MLHSFFNRIRISRVFSRFFSQERKQVFKFLSKRDRHFFYIIVTLDFRTQEFVRHEKRLKEMLLDLYRECRPLMRYRLRDIAHNKSFWLGFAVLKFLQGFLQITVEIKSEISELERHLKRNKHRAGQLYANSGTGDSGATKELNGERDEGPSASPRTTCASS